jgi:hypothetical protein
MITTGIIYAAFLAMFVGLLCLIWPLRFLGVRDRRTAALLFVAGVLTFVISANLPASETRIHSPRTQLDHFLPAYQFSELHSIRVAATRQAVYRALKAVTADDIFLYRTLVWMRRFGRPGPPSILNPPANQPLLDVATQRGFLLLADVPGESANTEILLGTLVVAPQGWHPSNPTPEGYKALANSGRPGFVFVAMNFLLEDCAVPASTRPCTLLTTETRIYATDPGSRRRFGRYWRVIYPGSSLIRAMWLRAIAKKAQTTG